MRGEKKEHQPCCFARCAAFLAGCWLLSVAAASRSWCYFSPKREERKRGEGKRRESDGEWREETLVGDEWSRRRSHVREEGLAALIFKGAEEE
ncbi:hypothetical protein KY285_004490 [Solanum tuberosum]|nr:hypothetical protein KY284_004684 [Solanum tuberosum]KAH0751342.1 hypothetical protein KY285_004490 [Solanum tuberosum]